MGKKKKFELQSQCGEKFCKCSGGKHIFCKVAQKMNDSEKDFLLGFSEQKKKKS